MGEKTADVVEEFRELVFDGIREALSYDGYCKVYEGTIQISLPGFLAGDGALYSPNHRYGVHLSCYVLGPGRHYSWFGSTLGGAIEQASCDVRGWIAENRADAWVSASRAEKAIEQSGGNCKHPAAEAYDRLLERATRLCARAMFAGVCNE